MLDLLEVRKAVVSELYSHLGTRVEMNNQIASKKEYPFLGYAFTSSYIADNGHGIYTREAAGDDVAVTKTTFPRLTLSLTAYDTDPDNAFQLAKKAHGWFSFQGYDYLKSNGLVVVEAGSIENRDTLIADDYERRQGFDVQLRTTERLTMTVPAIETVQIERSEG
ncbi:phage neck terminator protein [Salibacterium aidingense]|uniref:phage neck terminator protein n=1 Tax=Salibacterium aidingense TaxID=384933 RepID=UPI0004094A08|nr:hypothetical protein [Salibacterium aidingense]